MNAIETLREIERYLAHDPPDQTSQDKVREILESCRAIISRQIKLSEPVGWDGIDNSRDDR